MPIYTKKGDKGKTKTFLGEMSKGDALAEALGTIDELNSWIGGCRYELKVVNRELKRIQTNLLVIGSGLAGSKAQRLKGTEVKRLEKLIDKLTEELPPLKNFIYPLGGLQVARAVCRRAERRVVSYQLTVDNKSIKPVVKYLNRLSDALFTMARWVNFKMGIEEEIWK